MKYLLNVKLLLNEKQLEFLMKQMNVRTHEDLVYRCDESLKQEFRNNDKCQGVYVLLEEVKRGQNGRSA